MVPGVSALTAVPAAAGIPITFRGLAREVVVRSGYARPEPPGLPAGPRDETTYVYFMTMGRLEEIVDELLSEGVAPSAPAAIVERGTLPGQRVAVSVLADLPARAAGEALRPPALVVVGEVVRLARWRENRSLLESLLVGGSPPRRVEGDMSTTPAAPEAALDDLKPIAPHGGVLVDRELTGRALEEAAREASSAPSITLKHFEVSDVEMIASGALSPLTGFLGKADFQSVLERARLASGLVWSVPIVLARPAEETAAVRPGRPLALKTPDGRPLALLRVSELYDHDREAHAEKVFGTGDPAHPGVARVKQEMGPVAVAGSLDLLRPVDHPDFREHRLSPRQTRRLFQSRGWRTVVAFQTRNPIHRAHEYLTKVALEVVDGLLVHPLVGETKAGDIPADVRMRCYQALLENYYPRERTALAVFPAAMRYAGPREAVFHAIARKNYGVTHFIVGRDHAGVNRPDGKPYYGTYEAQEFVSRFSREDLGIEIFKFENTFFDRKTGGMVSEKTKPAGARSGERLGHQDAGAAPGRRSFPPRR